MTTNICYCLDCEWSGRQSACTMKWGKRFCPKCKSRRVEVRSVADDTDADVTVMLRESNNLGTNEL